MHMTTDMHDTGDGDALAALADRFGQLAVLLADGIDRQLSQQRLVEFAVRGVPGAEHASVIVVDGARPPRTTAGSDELPFRWDQLQYEYGEGPCLEAIATSNVTVAQDLRTDSRWPRFARAMVDQTPARSILSYQLFLTEQQRGRAEPVRHPPGRVHRSVRRHRSGIRRLRIDGAVGSGPTGQGKPPRSRVGDQPGDRGRNGHADRQWQAHQPAGLRSAPYRQPAPRSQTPRHRRRRRPQRTTAPGSSQTRQRLNLTVRDRVSAGRPFPDERLRIDNCAGPHRQGGHGDEQNHPSTATREHDNRGDGKGFVDDVHRFHQRWVRVVPDRDVRPSGVRLRPTPAAQPVGGR